MIKTLFEQESAQFAISKVKDGNMSYLLGDAASVHKNRINFLKKQGFKAENTVVMSVEHGEKILIVNPSDTGRGVNEIDSAPKVDALMTDIPDIVLGLLIADCLPIMFFDPENRAIAIAHLGWKGTTNELAPKVIENMIENFKSRPEKIKVLFGPAIHQESYAYWFGKAPQAEIPSWQPYLTKNSKGQISVDNIKFNYDQLVYKGVLAENIKIMPNDTGVDKNYFSHYRSTRYNETEGRFLACIALRSQTKGHRG